MKHKSPFQQFLRDSGVKTSKRALIMGLPYDYEPNRFTKHAKTTRNSSIPNKF